MKMNTLDWVAWILVVVGALNWGLVGAFNYNLVEMLFGMGVVAKWVYMLVGLGGVYFVWTAMSMSDKAEAKATSKPSKKKRK